MLYEFLTASFCVIVVVSNIISAKFIHLPFINFDIPAGLITYPLTFLLSDLTTEIFGPKKSKSMVYLAFAMSILSYGIFQLALKLPNNDLENQKAFSSIVGANGAVVFASLSAYMIAQLIDIYSYSLIKRWTGESHLWLRNNGSTLLSQIADTITVNLIHLYFCLGMPLESVLHIMILSYIYKAFFSFANTPIFYFAVHVIKKYRNFLTRNRSIQSLHFSSDP